MRPSRPVERLLARLERIAGRVAEILLGDGPPPPRIGLVCVSQPPREAVTPEEGIELDRRFWAVVTDGWAAPYDHDLEGR